MKSTFSAHVNRLPMGALLASGILFLLAVQPMTFKLWYFLFGVLLVFSLFRLEKWRTVIGRLVTFFLPVGLYSASHSLILPDPFSFTTLAFLSIGFLLGRLLRCFFTWRELAWATTLVGLVVGFARSTYNVFGANSPEPFIWMAIETGKNPAGWTLAFGVVSLFALGTRGASWRFRILERLLMGLLLLLLALTNSATALIATLMVLGLGALARFFVTRELSGSARLSLWLFGIFSFLFVSFAVANSIFHWVKNESLPFARNFLTLTGRTDIWLCYFGTSEGVAGEARWQETLACLGGSQFKHLHNLLLQAHLYGGLLFVSLFVFGFVLSLVVVMDKLRRLRGLRVGSDASEEVWMASILILSAIIGLAEPFVFWELQFGAVVLFAAAAGVRTDKVLQPLKRRDKKEFL